MKNRVVEYMNILIAQRRSTRKLQLVCVNSGERTHFACWWLRKLSRVTNFWAIVEKHWCSQKWSPIPIEVRRRRMRRSGRRGDRSL